MAVIMKPKLAQNKSIFKMKYQLRKCELSMRTWVNNLTQVQSQVSIPMTKSCTLENTKGIITYTFTLHEKKCGENELEREIRLKNNRDCMNYKRTRKKSDTNSRSLQSGLLGSHKFSSPPDNVKGVKISVSKIEKSGSKVIINLPNNLSKTEYLQRFDSSFGELHELKKT